MTAKPLAESKGPSTFPELPKSQELHILICIIITTESKKQQTVDAFYMNKSNAHYNMFLVQLTDCTICDKTLDFSNYVLLLIIL